MRSDWALEAGSDMSYCSAKAQADMQSTNRQATLLQQEVVWIYNADLSDRQEDMPTGDGRVRVVWLHQRSP